MCKCNSKCNCNITSTTKGEKGDAGATGATGPTAIYFIPLTDALTEFTVLLDGDYVLQLEANVERDSGESFASVSSDLTKNGVAEVGNNNGNHTLQYLLADNKYTYTHNAKINSVVAGDTIGFDLTLGFSLLINGSITIIKLP